MTTNDPGPSSKKPHLTLTVTEAAEELRVSRVTLYRILKRRDLRSVRVGSRLRIRRADLENYLMKLAQAGDRRAARTAEG